MGAIMFLVGAVLFGSVFYQNSYFKKYETVTKVTAFFKGWGYGIVFMLFGFMPILFASQYGVVPTVITSIIAVAATVGIFYLIITKRTKTLSEEYPYDKFIGAKEVYACMGMALYPFMAIFFIIFAIFLGTSQKKRN